MVICSQTASNRGHRTERRCNMTKPTVKTTVYVDRTFKKRAQKFAVEQGWTLSKLVYLGLRDYLDKHELPPPIRGPKHKDQVYSDFLGSIGVDIYDLPGNGPRPDAA